jgi:hypothetical protein
MAVICILYLTPFDLAEDWAKDLKKQFSWSHGFLTGRLAYNPSLLNFILVLPYGMVTFRIFSQNDCKKSGIAPISISIVG